MKKKGNKHIDVESCYLIRIIDRENKEVVFQLLKNDTIKPKQLTTSIKKQHPDIDFTGYKYFKIV